MDKMKKEIEELLKAKQLTENANVIFCWLILGRAKNTSIRIAEREL